MLRRILLTTVSIIYLPSASAALLGSGNLDVGVGSASLPYVWGVPAQTSVMAAFSGSTEGTILANEMFAIGSPSYTTTFSSGSTFDILARLLTNGENDGLGWNISNYWVGTSTGVAESFYFAGSPAVVNGVDFAGSTIERIQFSIVNNIASPGTDPNGDGGWTDWHFNLSMSVYGAPAVPEPSSLALALCALGGLVSIRRKANRLT